MRRTNPSRATLIERIRFDKAPQLIDTSWAITLFIAVSFTQKGVPLEIRTQQAFSQVVKESHLVLNPPVTKRDFINSMKERKPVERSAMNPPTLACTTFYGKQGTPLMGVQGVGGRGGARGAIVLPLNL